MPSVRRVNSHSGGMASANSTAWATISVSGPSCSQYRGASTARIGEKCSPRCTKSIPRPRLTPRIGLVGALKEAKPRTAWSNSVRSMLVAWNRLNLTSPSRQ